MITVYVLESITDNACCTGIAIDALIRLKEQNAGRNRSKRAQTMENNLCRKSLIRSVQEQEKNIQRVLQVKSDPKNASMKMEEGQVPCVRYVPQIVAERKKTSIEFTR